MPPLLVNSLLQRMPYGKFVGKTFAYIMSSQPSYIQWLSANVSSIQIHPDILRRATIAVHDKRKTKLVKFDTRNWYTITRIRI